MSATEAAVTGAAETAVEATLPATESQDDPLSDAALESIFADAPEVEGGDADEPAGTADDAAQEAAARKEGKPAEKPEEKEPEGIDLTLLKDEDEPAAAAKPEDDPYLKTIRQYLPTEEHLNTVIGAFNREATMHQAVANNDFPALYHALGANADKILEMFYQVGKDNIVERYVKEAKGEELHPEVAKLQKQVTQLTNFLQNGIAQNQQQAQTASQRKAFEAINTAIERDLTTARFPDDEYHKVQRDLIRQSVIADLAQAGTLQKAMTGDMKLVRAALRNRLTPLVEADRKRTETTIAKRAALTNKPKPIGEGSGATTQAPIAAAADAPKDRDSMLQQASDWLERQIKRGK